MYKVYFTYRIAAKAMQEIPNNTAYTAHRSVQMFPYYFMEIVVSGH